MTRSSFLPPSPQPAMVPKIDNVDIVDNVLTASVNTSDLTGWDLCLKVETTNTGEPQDYKALESTETRNRFSLGVTFRYVCRNSDEDLVCCRKSFQASLTC